MNFTINNTVLSEIKIIDLLSELEIVGYRNVHHLDDVTPFSYTKNYGFITNEGIITDKDKNLVSKYFDLQNDNA